MTMLRTLRILPPGADPEPGSLGYHLTLPSESAIVRDAEDAVQEKRAPDLPTAVAQELQRWLDANVHPGAYIDTFDATALPYLGAFHRLLLERLATLQAERSTGKPPAIQPPAAPGTPAIAAARPLFDRCRRWVEGKPDPGQKDPVAPAIDRASDPDVEAAHIARTVRTWLDERPAERRDPGAVLVLAPNGHRAGLIAEALESYGVPAACGVAIPLLESPLARWVLALAELQGWSLGGKKTERVFCRTIRTVLEAPYYSRRSATDGTHVQQGEKPAFGFARSDVQRALDTARRRRLALAEWVGHVHSLPPPDVADDDFKEELARRATDLADFSRLAGGAVSGLPGNPVRRLRCLLSGSDRDRGSTPHLGVHNKLRGPGGEKASAPVPGEARWFGNHVATDRHRDRSVAAMERIKDILDQWADELEADPEQTPKHGDALRAGLQSRMEECSIGDSRFPKCGVRVETYARHAGTGAEFVILAGLEDGGFPGEVKLPSREGLRALRAHGWFPWGIGGATDEPKAVAQAECALALECFQRNAAILARGLAAARQRLLLTLCRRDEQDRDTWPGAFLVGLPGLADQGHGGTGSVKDVTRKDLLRPSLAEAHGPLEARRRAHQAGDAGARLAGALGIPATDPALIVDQAHGDGVRNGSASTEPGVYEGVVPGTGLPADYVHSSTGLEAYAQCGYRYWLEKYLRIEARGESRDEPESMEIGDRVHEALCNAMEEAAKTSGGVLELFAPANQVKKLRDRLNKALGGEVQASFDTLSKEAPTFSVPLVDAYRERWGRVLAGFLERSVQSDFWLRFDPEQPEKWPEEVEREMEAAGHTPPSTFDTALKHWRIACRLRAVQLATCIPRRKEGRKPTKDWPKGTPERVRAEECGLLRFVKAEFFDKSCRKADDPRAEISAALAAKTAEVRTHLVSLARAIYAGFGFSSFPTRVLARERAYGMGSGPHPAPVTLALPGGRKLLLRGKVDRIDEVFTPTGWVLAIRDYKTGKTTKSGETLGKQILAGLHVQLPLYARLVAQVPPTEIREARPTQGVPHAALAFVRNNKQAHVALSEPFQPKKSGGNPGSPAEPLADTSLRHLEAYATGIQQGRFALQPRREACPLVKTSGAFCSMKTICRYAPERGNSLAADPTHPEAPVHPEAPPQSEASTPQADQRSDQKQDPKADKKPPSALAIFPYVAALAGKESATQVRKVEKRTHDLVADLDQDVVLTAGAGSGKTHQLVRRAMRAYAECSPLEVACITFTRKAAAEIRWRLRRAICAEPDSPDAKDVELARWVDAACKHHGGREVLLALVAAAPVTTIDGLCMGVLERIEHRLNARRIRVAGEDGADDFKDRIEAMFVEALDDGNPEVKALVRVLPPAAARESLVQATRDILELQLRARISGKPADDVPLTTERVLSSWRELIDRWIERACRDLQGSLARRLFDERGQIVEGESGAGKIQRLPKSWSDDAHEKWQGYWRKVSALREESAGALQRKKADLLDACRRLAGFLTAEREIRAKATNPGTGAAQCQVLRKSVLSEIVLKGAIGDLAKEHPSVDALAPALFEHLKQQAPVAAGTMSLARAWADELYHQHRDNGVLNYSEVVALLGEHLQRHPKEVARDYPLRHLIVDEFQDTNWLQIDLLRRLADTMKSVGGARSFFVGDLKQSIYRFRGAEVDGFEQAMDRLPEGTGQLRANRRSVKVLVEAFNRIFAGIFDGCDGDTGEPLDPDARIAFDPQRPEREDTSTEFAPGLEVIAGIGKTPGKRRPAQDSQPDSEDAAEEFDALPEDGADDAEAAGGEGRQTLEEAVAARLVTLLQDEKKREQRRPGPRAAVLFTDWERARRFAECLNGMGVKAACPSPDSAFGHREVNDLWLALVALIREDEAALVGWLRSPLVGLSDAGLWAVRTGAGLVNGDGQPIELRGRVRFREALRRACADDRWRLDARRALQKLQSQSGDLPKELRAALSGDVAPALQRDERLWARLVLRYTFWMSQLPIRGLADLAQTIHRDSLGDACHAVAAPDANAGAAVEDFIAGLRAREQTGLSPTEILVDIERELADVRGGSASGIHETPEYSVDADVECTTLWQAKGREWSLVVLPDLDWLDAGKRPDPHVLTRFVVRAGAPGGTPASSHELWVPRLKETHPEDPLAARTNLMGQLAGILERDPFRAETKRQLYVAMTRARDRLVIALSVPAHKADSKTQPFIPHEQRLSRARTGADLLCGALRLYRSAPTVALTIGPGAPLVVGKDGYTVTDLATETIPAPPPKGRAPGARPAAKLPAPEQWAALDTPALRWLNPSAKGSEWKPPMPPARLQPATLAQAKRVEIPAADLARAFGCTQRGDANLGNAFHELMERAAFAATPKPEDIATAVEAHARPGRNAQALGAKLLARLYAGAQAGQPKLWHELAEASRRGDLYHEVPMTVAAERLALPGTPPPAGRVDGRIDLLWRDGDGAWHLLDYKTGVAQGGAEDGGDVKALGSGYHAQVAAYAAGVAALLGPGERLADYGVWYVRLGVVVGWG